MKNETMFIDWLLHNVKPRKVCGGRLWNYGGGLFTADELRVIYESTVEPKLN
jgi:hypothetical protein